VTSSYDHVITGTKNFGKKASEQRPTITVQTLKQLGLSEQAAEYVQFSIDLFSVGKSGSSMPKAKPVSDAKPRWEVDRKLNKLTTREQVEKNVQEIRNGNKNSNFSQHAQLEREINKLKSADEINFADGMGKFTDSMNDKAFSRLVKSVKENGFTNPVVEYVEINGKAYIVRGNNRVFAAEYLGRIHELKFKKVDFPVPNTSWKNPTDVLNESGNVKRPRYRSK
ncbi:TPA: ParB N-terminal domain-containing protein, partial [Neisseria meningitidis]